MARGKKLRKVMMPKGAMAVAAKWEDTRGSYLTSILPIDETRQEEVEVFSVREPFSYGRVIYDRQKAEYMYEVWEPQLDDKEKRLLDSVKDALNRTLEYDWEKMSAKDKEQYLGEAVESFLKSRGIKLEPTTREKLEYYIIRDFVGYGPIDSLMSDPRIEDVSCDGVGIPLFIFHQKYESVKTSVVFADEDVLNNFVVALGQRCGKQISVAAPILDGTSFEGHRVQATYAREVTTRGSSFTIRRFKEKPFTPIDLIKYNTASPEMVAYVWIAIEHGESMMVCGGTASGKTATLNAAALFIRPGAKIVSIEDTREINLPHENWIPGTTRSGIGERGADGKAPGEIDMFDLVRAALRQRPNFIIVGEVRGKETYTMFQAMATGHPTMSSMHADSVKSMVNRLENPPINTPRILLTALKFVIIQTHARVGDSVVRRIKQIVELVGFEPETNELITNTVYEWDQASDSFNYKGHSFVFDELMEMKNMTHEEMEQEFQRRVDLVNYMVEKGMNDFREISKVVVSYYQYPEETAKRIREEMGWARETQATPGELPGGDTLASG
ncbi:MAG: type II/IV secretion system ATPase subunit [Candidatus Thermoplasmatota archaeon]